MVTRGDDGRRVQGYLHYCRRVYGYLDTHTATCTAAASACRVYSYLNPHTTTCTAAVSNRRVQVYLNTYTATFAAAVCPCSV